MPPMNWKKEGSHTHTMAVRKSPCAPEYRKPATLFSILVSWGPGAVERAGSQTATKSRPPSRTKFPGARFVAPSFCVGMAGGGLAIAASTYLPKPRLQRQRAIARQPHIYRHSACGGSSPRTHLQI